MPDQRMVFNRVNWSEHDPAPLYLLLQRHIREAVRSGELRPRDVLPSERDMAERLGLSRVTVRKALRGLAESGLLVQKRGAGNFIADAPPRVEQALARLTSFSEDMQRRGLKAGSHWLLREVSLPSPVEAMRLNLSPEDRVVRLRRLRLANDLPMAIELATLAERDFPDPEDATQSLYEVLEARGLAPVRALQRISAVNLSSADAALLGVFEGAAALGMERVTFLPDGRPIEFTHSLYRGDAYDLITELKTSR
jgi:GntR family transcriptional regulator